MTPAVRLRGSFLATGLALGLALACLAPNGALAARSQPWERRKAAGLAALEAPRFADAGQRFAVALRQAERRGPDLAESLGRLGALDIILGHFAAAALRLRATGRSVRRSTISASCTTSTAIRTGPSGSTAAPWWSRAAPSGPNIRTWRTPWTTTPIF